MLFDSTLLFFHAGSSYNFSAGEFVNMAGQTASSASQVINLGNARDLGIGNGEEIPQLALIVGQAFTSATASMTINFQFQGSTDSNNWTTYAESGAQGTASLFAGAQVLPIDVPRRPAGAALPLYYRVNMVVSSPLASSISTGTIIGGIVLERDGSADTLGLYPSGFTVA